MGILLEPPAVGALSLVLTGLASKWDSTVAPIWNVLMWAPCVLASTGIALAQATLSYPETLPVTAPNPPAPPQLG